MTLTRTELHDRARADLAGLRSADGWLMAGLPRFARLFGRDSCIAALQVLADDPGVAEATVRALARCQGRVYHRRREEQPGKIGHEIPTRWTDRVRMELRKQFRWGFPYYGTIDATALWVKLVGAHAERTGDLALVEEVRPNLCAAARWMAGDARIGHDDLVAYQRVNPAGLEHQAWRDADMGDIHIEAPVSPVEVQGYHRAAVAVLDRLGVAVVPAARIDPEVFVRSFWMGDEDTCALAVDGQGRQVAVVTSNPGHLLGTGTLGPVHEKAVADRLGAEDLLTPFGIRTHSTLDPNFDPLSYQRGSVWPHDNWMIHEGLRAIGRNDDARRVRRGVLDACRTLGSIPELYAVADGHPLSLTVAQPVQAWSSGAVLAFLRAEDDD